MTAGTLSAHLRMEFALAHWLVNGAEGGRLFVRCFGGDGTVRENAAGDVLASLTTMVSNAPSEAWAGGVIMTALAQPAHDGAARRRGCLRAGRRRGPGSSWRRCSTAGRCRRASRT
jgi:hypothetical protein